MSNNVFSEFNTHGITYKDIQNIQRSELKFPLSQTNLDYNINDTFTKSSTKKDFSDDDGKISFKDKIKNFAKGIVSPITTMFSSPKNFAIGAVSIVGISVLVAATGGAITPLLIASGVTMGSIQIAKSAYNAATATTDDEARQAWQGMGAGTTAVAGSVAGAKGALKASGVDTANMSALEATLQCFKSVPSSIGKSFNAFRTGAALTNIKNAFGINKKESSEGTKTDNKSLEETDNIKNETKADSDIAGEVKTENKTKQPETKSETKTEAKIETKEEVKTEQKPEAKAEPKPETKTETKPEVKAETKPEVKTDTKTEVVQQDISAEGQSGYSKKLTSLSEKEAAAFERAKNILDSQGIEYSDEELLMDQELWGLHESLTNDGAADCHAASYGFNFDLRNKPKGYIPENLESRILDKGLENLSPLKQNETVYRGVNGNRFFKKRLEYVKSLVNAKKGDVISDKGYGYASFSKKIANHYTDGGVNSDAQGVRMKIIVPKGSKVSIAGYQQEMLFPRNAQFKVVKQAKIAEDGIMEIVLKYILPKD